MPGVGGISIRGSGGGSGGLPAPAAVTLTAPTAATAMVYVGQDVTVTATTTDTDVTMTWLLDGNVIATDAASPYSQTWTVSEAVASYTLVARATRWGQSTDSAPLTVYVIPGNITFWRRGDDHATGALVALTDRGPVGNGATGTATGVAAALDGHKSIQFNGTTDMMASGLVNWAAKTGATMFMVAKDTAAGASIIVEKGDLGTQEGIGLYANVAAGKLTIAHKGDGGVYKSKAGDSGATLAAFTLVECVWDLTQGDTDEAKMLINGTEEATYTVGNGAGVNNTSMTQNSPFTEGARWGVVAPWAGEYTELVIFDTTLSVADRAVVRAGINALYPSLP